MWCALKVTLSKRSKGWTSPEFIDKLETHKTEKSHVKFTQHDLYISFKFTFLFFFFLYMNWHPVGIIPKFCDCSCYQILGILVLSLKCLPEQRVKVHFAADSCFLWLKTLIFTFITWLTYFRWDHGHCCLPLAIIQFKWTESDKHNGTIFHYSFTFNYCADVHVVTTLGPWSLCGLCGRSGTHSWTKSARLSWFVGKTLSAAGWVNANRPKWMFVPLCHFVEKSSLYTHLFS